MFPSRLDLSFERRATAALRREPASASGVLRRVPASGRLHRRRPTVLHGKELSFNNLLDLDSALNLVREFADPAAVVIKHNNPCGCRRRRHAGRSIPQGLRGRSAQCLRRRPRLQSRAWTRPTAMQITEPKRFVECIIAPDFTRRRSRC